MTPAIRPDAGSFRDPLSRVYVEGDVVRRGLSAEGAQDYERLAATRFFRQALDDGDIVATEPDPDGLDGWATTLRHDRVAPITYPYEWSWEMLRDAARLQLRLTRAALAEGMTTKDATSYNVQFRGARPVFIDVGSFEAARREPWPGYGQFCNLFLNPLLVQAVAEVPFQPLLRGALDGISPATTSAVLGGRGKFTKGVFTNVKLLARAEERYANADQDHDTKRELRQAGFGPAIIDAQLKNLQKAIDGLSWNQQASTWSDYSDRGHYTDRDLATKTTVVAEATTAFGPARVLDLGANDGHFSRLAITSGATTAIAVDSDHLVVDRLYRTLRDSGQTGILPLVIDLADPSPGLGWRNRERPPFIERVRPDLTLALAVVHHLALTNNVPFDGIVELFADLGAPLVVEFPHRDDPMASRLLGRKRDGLFDHYDQPQWEAALTSRFHVERQLALPSGTRTLYVARPR